MRRSVNLRRLGTVLHISKQGSIIVKTDKTPPIGARVVDKKAQTVGKVLDVFGPVKTPYVSIAPKDKKNMEHLVGQVLYLYKK
jgi:RNA-binding protein